MKNILLIGLLFLASSCETGAGNDVKADSTSNVGQKTPDTAVTYKPDTLLKPGQYPPTGDTSTNGAENGQNTGIIKDTTSKKKKHHS